jgi:pimeloyl-ACP methyl ester carboxylesterase
LARFERLTQSPGAAVAELRKHSETDVRGVLPSIHVPSLVLHRPDDAFIDARSPHYMADRIPDARFAPEPSFVLATVLSRTSSARRNDRLPWATATGAIS